MSDDLNTEIKIGADASGVEAGVGKAKRSLASLGESAKKAGQDAGAGLGSIGAGGDKSAKDVERATKSMQGSLQRLLAEQKAGAKGSREYYEALADTRGISRGAIKPILDQIDAAKSKTLQAQAAAESWQGSIAKIGPAMAAAFSVAAIGGVIGKVVAVQREFDVLNSSLKTVTGSSAAAERELEWLKDFAKTTPFGLAQATQGFVKMKALGLDPTRAALTSFGNTASAMGKDLNQMIEAVADASTGEFERLKEFGIKAKKEGDNVSLTFQGVTTTVKNSAAEITKYLEDIGNNQFGGAMEERAKTLDGTIAALGDTWDELFRTVSSNNVGSLIFDSVTLANGALEDATTILKAMGGAAKEAGEGTGALVTIQGGIATVFETVAVLGANLKFVLVSIGNEIGGLAAQVAQAAQFNFSGVAAIRQAMVADAEAARKEIDATTERILRARKAQEEYARFATRNASAATDPRRIDLSGTSAAAARAVSAGVGKAVKEAVSEYDKLIQKLGEELPKAAAEAEAAQMGYNKAQTEFLALARSPVWATFTNEQRASVATLFESKIASEQAGEAEKLRAQTLTDLNKTLDEYAKAQQAGVSSAIDAATQAETQLAQYGLLKSEVQGLTLAYLEQSRESAALAGEDVSNIDKRISAQKRLIAATRGLEAREIADTAAKAAADEWRRTSESIEQSLTDSLLRGFESGKGFAKNFVDTMKNLFSTLVLRPIISAVVNPVAGAITGALGLSGTASAATSSAGSGASTALSAASLFGAGGLGGSLAAGAGWLTGATTLGGSLTAGASLIGTGTLAGLTSGVGVIAGALGPIALGVGALTAIAKATKGETRTGGQFGVAFDGAVTNQRRDQTYTIEGQQFDRDFTNGLQTALRDGLTYRLEGDPVAQESAIKAAVSGTASGINGILKALGSEARLAGFSAGLETSGKGRGGVFAGGTFADGRTFGESGKGDNYQGTLYEKFSSNSPDFKAALENFTLDLKQSTIQALQSVADIPKSVKSLLDGVDAEGLADDAANALLEAINAQILGVDQLKQAFATIGFDKLAALSFDAASGLAAASGGFDKLISNLDTYYSNFFSADEQRAQIQKNLEKSFASLNIPLPDIDAKDARAQFRLLVEKASGDLSETGQKTYAALLQLSGSFAQITPEAAAVVQAVESVSQAMQRLTGDSASLQIDLLRAQGNTTGADAAQRTLDTTGLSDAEIAIYDYNTSLRSQIGALNDAAQATADQAAIRADFERQLLQLQGDTAALRLLDIAGMDAANVALYDRVQALTASQAEEQAAAAAAQQQASTRAGFERQLLQLQGDTAALRLLDIAGMDAANVALYDRVQALQAEQAAEQAAAAAAAQQASTRAGFERQLLELQGDTAALRLLDIAGMDAANVALYDRIQALTASQAAEQAATASAAQQANTRAGLERQLLQLQGDTTALRLLDIAGMDAANVALYDRVQALTASQAAEQAAADKAKQVAQERYGIETNMLQLQGNTAALRARELALLDPANRADQLRLYILQDAQEAAKSAADAERDLAAARVQSAQDAYRAAQDATGGAFDALSRSVDAERSLYESTRAAAADAAQEIKSVIDTLAGSIQDLYAGVDSTRQAGSVEGSAFITRALQAARTTGYLPDAKGLSDAISQARGALGSQNYATQFEADRAQLVMAGQLSELSDIAKPQLTAAERTLRNAEDQLKALDDILKNAQSQVDAVRGISTTVGTISDALFGLQAALLSEAQAKAQAQATTPPPATAPTTPTTGTGGALSGPYAAQITEAIKAAAYTADDRLVYDTARMLGVTSSELDKLMGWTAGTSLDWAKRNNLPAFAVGTNYVPRDMLATIHEGEAIVPKAFNPWAAGGQGMGGSNAEVVAELRALRQQNERLESRLASIEGSNNTMVSLLDDVTDGGNAMRSEVMA